MAASVQEFFDGLSSRIDPAKAAGFTNSYVFDVAGAGTWTVAVRGGVVEVTEGPGEADATITVAEDVLLRVINGEQNATAAYMTGKLKVKGDMGAALKLQNLF